MLFRSCDVTCERSIALGLLGRGPGPRLMCTCVVKWLSCVRWWTGLGAQIEVLNLRGLEPEFNLADPTSKTILPSLLDFCFDPSCDRLVCLCSQLIFHPNPILYNADFCLESQSHNHTKPQSGLFATPSPRLIVVRWELVQELLDAVLLPH